MHLQLLLIFLKKGLGMQNRKEFQFYVNTKKKFVELWMPGGSLEIARGNSIYFGMLILKSKCQEEKLNFLICCDITSHDYTLIM